MNLHKGLVYPPVPYLCAVWLTEAVQAEQLAAGVAPRDHAWAHATAREVLQLLVDVQVPDAALEAGAVQQLGGAAGG